MEFPASKLVHHYTFILDHQYEKYTITNSKAIEFRYKSYYSHFIFNHYKNIQGIPQKISQLMFLLPELKIKFY